MNSKKLQIGLFGFGTVGSGLYDVLKRIGSKNVEIKRICVRDISKKRRISNKIKGGSGIPLTGIGECTLCNEA